LFRLGGTKVESEGTAPSQKGWTGYRKDITMCDNRDGKIVVPKTPSAGMGFWIGAILETGEIPLRGMFGKKAVLYKINVLWVQRPEYKVATPLFSSGPFHEFDDEESALRYLQSLGV
jgi:hypothetical protein